MLDRKPLYLPGSTENNAIHRNGSALFGNKNCIKLPRVAFYVRPNFFLVYFTNLSTCGLGFGKNDEQVQPAVSNSFVVTGCFIGHHVRFVGDFNFPAAVSTGGSEGLWPVQLVPSPRRCVGRAAACVHGALRAGPHPQFELRSRVSAPRILLYRGLPRRKGHREVRITFLQRGCSFPRHLNAKTKVSCGK